MTLTVHKIPYSPSESSKAILKPQKPLKLEIQKHVPIMSLWGETYVKWREISRSQPLAKVTEQAPKIFKGFIKI